VYHQLPMCHLYIEISIKFSVSECLSPYKTWSVSYQEKKRVGKRLRTRYLGEHLGCNGMCGQNCVK
jgi:hypothetical protein